MPDPAPIPVPEGMSTVTPHLWFSRDCAEAIEFDRQALRATLDSDPIPAPDGTSVWHAMLRIGDSNVFVADASGEKAEAGPAGQTAVGFFLYVDDCDA